MAIIKAGQLANLYYDFAVLNDMLYMTTGQDRNLRDDGDDTVGTRNMSIRMTGTVPTFNAFVDGSLAAGDYVFRYTYYNSVNKVESDPSDLSAVITVGAHPNDGVKINIPANASLDPQVDKVRVYRSHVDTTIVYYDGEADYSGTAITYDSTVVDTGLGSALGEVSADGTVQTFKHGVAPTCPYIESWNSRLWLAGNKPYSTGTVTITNGVATIVGLGTNWVDGMTNLNIVFPDVSSRIYTIDSVTATTGITLTETIVEDTTSGLGYVIFAEGNFLYYSYIDLDGIPHGDYFPSDNWILINKDDGDVITGLQVIKNRLLITKYSSLYMISGSTNFMLLKVNSHVGCVSNKTLTNDEKGNAIFLSDRGVYICDGDSTHCISDNIENLFTGEGNPPWTINTDRLVDSHGVYDITHKRYWLWVTSGSNTYTDKCLIADFNLMDEGGQPEWFPADIPANASGIIKDAANIPEVYFGDTQGYVCRIDNDAINDGAGSSSSETRRGTATAGGNNTLTDSGATFNTTGDGLTGTYISILSGTGEGQKRRIASNTGTILTTASNWTTNPSTDSVYAIGAIDAYWKSKIFTWDSLKLKILKWFKVVFKTQGSSYNLSFDRYEDASDSSKETSYLDMSKDPGYGRVYLSPNKARYHQFRIRIYDTDRPVLIREIEVEAQEKGL